MNKKKILIGLGIVAGVLLLLVLAMHFVGKLGSFRGTSFYKYRDYAYTGAYYDLWKLPDGAEDFRFQCTNLGLGAQSYAGFTLTGEDYDTFVLSLLDLEEPSDLAKEKFIGKKVSDTYYYYNDGGYSGSTGFPKKKIRYTAKGDISDFTILYYNAYRGSRINAGAVLVNPATGRVVIYCEGSN